MGIILTADCDIDKGKAGPELVYVPIVSHQTYLADDWLPNEASLVANKGRTSLNKQLASLDAKMSDRHIYAWGQSGGTEKIAKELADRVRDKADGATSPKLIEKIARLWEATQVLDQLGHKPPVTQTDQLPDLMHKFISQKRAIEPSSDSPEVFGRNAIQAALEAVQSRLDMWLISDLIGLDPEMVHGTTYGFVVPLRSFSLIPMERIEVDRAKWYENSAKYLRICRLRGIYKSDLLQRFANMFVRVGLEDHRDEQHRRSFTRCAQSLFPGVSK